jgi:hypothetical protein
MFKRCLPKRPLILAASPPTLLFVPPANHICFFHLHATSLNFQLPTAHVQLPMPSAVSTHYMKSRKPKLLYPIVKTPPHYVHICTMSAREGRRIAGCVRGEAKLHFAMPPRNANGQAHTRPSSKQCIYRLVTMMKKEQTVFAHMVLYHQ